MIGSYWWMLDPGTDNGQFSPISPGTWRGQPASSTGQGEGPT